MAERAPSISSRKHYFPLAGPDVSCPRSSASGRLPSGGAIGHLCFQTPPSRINEAGASNSGASLASAYISQAVDRSGELGMRLLRMIYRMGIDDSQPPRLACVGPCRDAHLNHIALCSEDIGANLVPLLTCHWRQSAFTSALRNPHVFEI